MLPENFHLMHYLPTNLSRHSGKCEQSRTAGHFMVGSFSLSCYFLFVQSRLQPLPVKQQRVTLALIASDVPARHHQLSPAGACQYP